MNQAEIKSPEIRYNSGFEVSQFTRESQGQPVKKAIFILSSCVLLLHLNPSPARIKIDFLRISPLESLEHQGVS